jgi:hypothetical protein
MAPRVGGDADEGRPRAHARWAAVMGPKRYRPPKKHRKTRNTLRMYLVDTVDLRLQNYLAVLVVNARDTL